MPGIHRVDGTWGGNVYLLVDDEKLVLIDAALPGNAGKILRYIERLGRKPSDLTNVILTHAHPDHTGTIPTLSTGARMKVLVHPGDTKRDDDGRLRLHYPGQIATTSWSVPFLGKIHADETLEDGRTLPIMGGMEVLHTPGHTPGSISLYLKQREVLFTGDMLIGNGTRFHRPLPFPGTDFKLYRRSVERLAQLRFDVACVGHGRPLVGGAVGELHRMLENYSWAGPWWAPVRKLIPSCLRCD